MSGQDKILFAFDWNGVIPNDAWTMHEATNAVLAHFGKPLATFEEYQRSYDMPISKSYLALGFTESEIDANSAEIVRVWRNKHEALVPQVCLREGVREALELLSSNNCPCVVFSNYVNETITDQAQRFGVTQFFEKIFAISRNDPTQVMHKRLKGEWLNAWILEKEIKKVVVIGDSLEEIEYSRANGRISVAITGGCCDDERLNNASPDHIIKSFAEWPDLARRSWGLQ